MTIFWFIGSNGLDHISSIVAGNKPLSNIFIIDKFLWVFSGNDVLKINTDQFEVVRYDKIIYSKINDFDDVKLDNKRLILLINFKY